VSTIPSEKQTLRLRGLELVRALSAAERAAKSLAIGRHLSAVEGPVFGFAPLRLEPDWLSAWDGEEFALPRIERETMAFHRMTHRTELTLTEGPFGTREPVADEATRMDLSAAATILVPGLAFDRTGGRLGRGGGFYDRFLADPAVRGRRVGVCFARQIFERVPIEEHDAMLDAIVTEDGWIEVRSSGRGRD
jgi:5-formyltetrahydrofolate cyclo-ligase